MRPLSSISGLIALISLTHASGDSDLLSSTSRSLLTRQSQDSCKAVDSRLPDSFKCDAGSNCISLDNGTSALCCPDGNTCNNIATIPCDISLQDASKNPDASILTTRVRDKLPTCGSKCCPFGYNCISSSKDESAVCGLILSASKSGKESTSSASSGSSGSSSTDTSAKSSSTVSNSVTSSTSSSTEIPTSSSTSTSTSAAIASGSTANPTKDGNKFPAAIFAGGIGVGIVLGFLLTLLWVIFTGRHKKPDNRNSTSSSTIFKPQISDPIPMQTSGRTEFLRRTGQRARSIFSNRDSNLPVSARGDHNGGDNWKMPTPPSNNNNSTPAANIVNYPVTPERRLPHDSVAETIKIYSPPTVPAMPPNIAPLRGMNAQRFNNDRNNNDRDGQDNYPMGSPFQTPPGATSAANDDHSIYPDDDRLARQRALSSYSAVSSLHDLSGGDRGTETLAAARYDGGSSGATGYGGLSKDLKNQNQQPGHNDAVAPDLKSRPTTTFTEMLHDVGFPDPYIADEPVPKIPDRYGRK